MFTHILEHLHDTNKFQRHRQEVCNRIGSFADTDKWVVIGEWSGAMTDCAAALNGYGIGARYEGNYPGSFYVGSCSNINFIETWDQSLRDDTRWYIETQLSVYERYTRGKYRHSLYTPLSLSSTI